MSQLVTFKNFNEVEKKEFNIDNNTKGALEVLEWAYSQYQDEIVYACSFGIEGIVMIDLLSKVTDKARIVFLDTGVHFDETYELIDKVKKRYPTLTIELKKPKLTLEEQAEQFGAELWKSNPNQCCNIRKIQPLNEVLSGVTAWISGLRREQSESRKNTEFINLDKRFESIKVCPLIHWSWKDIWRYAHKNELDYNTLHDNGYPSIGCKTCTKPAFNADDLRSGRWTGTNKVECGLHT
ncbi:phosphoadenylyl-sulfate reductase [Bacillus sp. PS06]|uniref:phosphoadenylyl-sulfate reductase n=1 Tax=Bacillus sp. PS06 TaxID=2764176 RepID=UPI0017827B23|nr:phosphoadenylyl-sulfate reductase [Bacillus sp. PS06]MBD8071269.1 phosphoadenylyl-sulfate reductase [Bacillus sp. PS06]